MGGVSEEESERFGEYLREHLSLSLSIQEQNRSLRGHSHRVTATLELDGESISETYECCGWINRRVGCVSSLSGTSLEGSVEAIPHRIFVVYGGVLQINNCCE